MNKLILCFLCLATLPLYAQDEAPLELDVNEETVTNPLDKMNQPVIEEDAATTTESEVVAPAEPAAEVETAEAPEDLRTDEEFVAPAVPGAVKPVSAEKRPSPVFNLEAEVDDKKRFNPRESHWVTTFAFENTRYEVIPEERFEFEGRKDFAKGMQELWGGRIGLGGEIYLGAGFVTRSMVEGYYLGTLFSRVLNGGEEAEDIEFAYTKRTGQILGVDASQSLGWMFDFKTKNPFMEEWAYLTVETYVEAGIGKAYGYNRINYSYDTGPSPSGAQEGYKLRVRDDLLNARIGAGMNFTSSKGFFLALKATVNRYELTQRKIDGFTRENGTPGPTEFNETQKDAKMDPIVIYTLGGGYKF